jgi:glutamine amidotransferase
VVEVGISMAITMIAVSAGAPGDARVAVIDYGMGNLGSVRNALRSIGAEEWLAGPGDIDRATHLVLPGVGAFGDGMANLERLGWLDLLEAAVIERRVPILGICLGMQLLATVGTENGDHKGLGWIDGEVVRLPATPDARIPHIGWNDVHATRPSLLLEGQPDPVAFYFVHSFALRPDDPTVTTGSTEHGSTFAATVELDNIHGAQFHPEKSHRAGLQLLRSFLSC